MLEPRIVESPTAFPARCLLCPSQKGPILDTGVDTPFPGPNAAGAVYICRSCGRQIAKAYGFAKGEKLEQLENAAEERDRYEKQLRAMEGDLNKMASALTLEQQAHSATQVQLESERDARHQDAFITQQIASLTTQYAVRSNGD